MAAAEASQLARQCHDLFVRGSLDSCQAELQKLKAMRNSDFQIAHNISVCQFHKAGCKDVAGLLAELQKLKGDLESKKSDQDAEDGVDEVDAAVLNCNIAVVAMALRKYATASETLERLFRTIEPLEELLAIRLCMMLLDCLAMCRLPDRGAQVMAYLEKAVQGLSAQRPQAASQAPADGSARPQVEETSDAACQAYGFASLSHIRVLLSLYKAKQFLVHRNVKSAKREIKAAVAGSQAATLTAPLMLKAHLEYIRGNLSKSQKLLSSLSDPSCLPLQLNNMGCLHFRARKYGAASLFFRKALTELSAASAQQHKGPSDGTPREEMLYNIGLQQLLLGRPLEAFASLSAACPLFYSRPRLWIRLAECCIAHHAMQQGSEEARAESEMVRSVTGVGPRRRALLPFGLSSRRGKGPRGVRHSGGTEGKGEDGAPGAGGVGADGAGGKGGAEQPTMEYAQRCLQNALFLLSRDPSPPAPSWDFGGGAGQLGGVGLGGAQWTESGDGAQKDGEDGGSGGAGAEKKEAEERWALTEATLLKLAYVSLVTDSPVQALAAAEQLLAKQPQCAASSVYAARMYAAEALCLLEHPDASLDMLRPLLEDSAAHDAAPADKAEAAAESMLGFNGRVAGSRRVGGWAHLCEATGSGAASRCAVRVNVAAAHVMAGQLGEARTMVQHALSALPSSAPALLLAVYLDIRGGNKERALTILKLRRSGGGG